LPLRPSIARLLAPGAGLLTALLYAPTVATTVTLRNGGGDSGELVRAAWTLGIPHPTGYPLWLLLAHAATWLPSGEPAQRVALLSMAASALAVCFVVLAGRELLLAMPVAAIRPAATLWAPTAGGLVLAGTPLYWQQATIPETYALDSCLVAGGLVLLLRWLRGAAPLWSVTLVLALGLANHLISLAFAAGLVVALLLRRPRPVWAELAGAALPLLLTPALYGLLLLRARAHPLADWGDPQTLGALWRHVSAAEYHHFLGSRTPAAVLLDVARLPQRLRQQFSTVGAIAVVWAVLLVITRAPRLGLVLLAIVLTDVAIVARDAAPAAPAYLSLTYLILAIALGAGAALLPALLFPTGRTAAIAQTVSSGGVLLLAILLLLHTRPLVDIHADRSLERTARADLLAVPPQGLLLTEGDNPTFALWYLQDVLGIRPDVVIWTANLALDPWYTRQMHRRYPTVIPAALPNDPQAATARVVAANEGTRAIVTVAGE
jgi:hypothetical protein